jgi:hypothetical protein
MGGDTPPNFHRVTTAATVVAEHFLHRPVEHSTSCPIKAPDARSNPERSVVECVIGVGEYEGVVRVSRRVFQILLSEGLAAERCLEGYHLHPARLELIAEGKVRRRQLTDDGNVEITGRDLWEREVRARHPRPIGYRRGAS